MPPTPRAAEKWLAKRKKQKRISVLARRLRCTPAKVAKFVRAGMPTDHLEGAIKWHAAQAAQKGTVAR
jgi:hypothetical protein